MIFVSVQTQRVIEDHFANHPELKCKLDKKHSGSKFSIPPFRRLSAVPTFSCPFWDWVMFALCMTSCQQKHVCRSFDRCLGRCQHLRRRSIRFMRARAGRRRKRRFRLAVVSRTYQASTCKLYRCPALINRFQNWLKAGSGNCIVQRVRYRPMFSSRTQ